MAFTEKEAAERVQSIHKQLTGKDLESFNVPSWIVDGIVSGKLEMYTCEPYRVVPPITPDGKFYAS